MASEHDYPVPRSAPHSPLPPPPPPPPPRLQLQTPQTSPLRRIAVQPPLLTTALAPPQGASFLHGHQTPVSAVSLNVPFSPYAPSPSTYAASPVSSPMTMRNASSASVPYNPQQWGRNAPVGGQYAPHLTQTPTATARPREVTGMEAALPSPPPPYSPGQNHTISQAVGSSPHQSGNAFPSHQSHPLSAHPLEYIPSPPSRPVSGYGGSRPTSMVVPTSAASITSNPQFPPPPPGNGKGRSASRDKLHSKFSLSNFRNRGSDHSPAPNAIDALRINTSEAISRIPGSPGLPGQRISQLYNSNPVPERQWSPESPIRAPASRRAASAGFLGLATEARTPIEYSPSLQQGNWGATIPLPPPPPGPPPSSSRSQSLGPGLESNVNRQTVNLPAPPTRRPGQSSLTPIPPTPVGWHEDPRNRSKSPAARGLYIDTSPRAIRSQAPPVQISESEDVSVSSGPTASTNSSSTLYRSPNKPTKRDNSALGIRERRSESRAARERVEPNNNPWAHDMEAASTPNDLVLRNPDPSLSRRGASARNTPRSAGALRTPRSAQLLEEIGSSNTTPRAENYRGVASGASVPTPPFSPGTDTFDPHHARKALAAIPTKALPTPPLRHYADDGPSSLTSQSGGTNRSTSQTSYISDSKVEESSASTPRATEHDLFAQASIERHRLFVDKESAAHSDQERLELFAEFIVAESRLRRDRYSGAFDTIAGDIVDLTRDLWRSYGSTGRRSATPSAQSASVPSGRRSQASTIGESPDTRFSNSVPTTAASPASSVTNFTPHTEPNSPSSANSQRARDTSWNNNYQPCLSPIPSMAVSTVPDEEDSRGRSASRWWEASNDGASSGIGSRRLERSKRESKYMSLPKEARESLQWAGENEPSPGLPSGPSHQQAYGANEYPPEKTGFHEEMRAPQVQSYGFYPNSAPATPDPHRLDVSRLVTLPPPYPRHHPAVNNSHPDLASIRSNLRGLADMEEVKSVKERFTSKMNSLKEQESTALSDRRAQLRYNVQHNVRNGVMNFDDAAAAEADFEAREEKRAQEAVQSLFDSFQADVANPLHAMFCERITKVSASIEHLKGRLSNDAQEFNPNQTQEEGDEQPELLEMLTLLKWLFEAREQLHKEMFELEDERNDLYKDIIILPYIQAKNDQKVKEASVFFSRDAQDRKVVFEKEILKRYEDFMNAIEENVTRGVEAQLSAFWDIAPGLLTVVQKIPQRLQGFDILIPPQEFEENPIYHDFPMQYLYSLLAHAGRSASQFIESQTNLLCLLHEVKTGVMTAGSRLLETQRILEGEDLANVDSEMRAIREDEEARLTDDLKDKVGLVESQWGEALGNGLEDCKKRVETFLVNSGGWDESLKD
ncbi:hypothetical protein K505DRAFT_267583 [Melanomma pulvis-pyrius CBS 109.77]|uniref:Uncharacterized protein n=1 Tax=Melanomma pulvis-pyrius CBS 109.77 TaxID=1314802 RepID=A0A6A6XSC6_9PLEO|nr:hypothetical protein K505DRAFT_267583 [Melanomma pulvis-pyrius CBS 109.77]